jgi:hypothetical protein
LNHLIINYFQPGISPLISADTYLKLFPAYMQSYREWYTHCLDCVKNSTGKWLPQAPSGMVPSFRHHFGGAPQDDMVNGLEPFDKEIDFQALRSGNVYIIANEINIGRNFGDNSAEDPPACSGDKTLKRFSVDARGVRGGRGGAGTPSFYIGPGNAPATSVSGDTGPGGRGGDAGNITLVRVNGMWNDSEKKQLLETMRLTGGLAGDNNRYKAPTWDQPLAPTGSYCDFLRAPQVPWSKSPNGNAGTITVRSLSSTDATAFVGQLVQSKDARLDYDLQIFAERAEKNSSIAQLTFDDYLVTALADALGRAEVHAVDHLQQIIIDSQMPVGPLTEEYLLDLDFNSSLAFNLSNRSRVFGRQLSLFTDRSDSLISYLRKSGGLFNIASRTPFNRFISESTRLDLAAQATALHDLQVRLTGIGTTLAEIDIRQERQERLAAIAALQSSIASAIKETQSQSSLAWAGELGQALGAAAASGTALYSAYQLADPSSVLSSGGKFLADLDNIRSIWSGNSEGVTGIDDLRHMLTVIQEEYLQFVSQVAETRRQNSDRRMQDLASALGARNAQGSRRETRHAQFQDLVRSAVISHLINPPRDAGTFVNNLDSLRVFLTIFPASEPYFQFRDFDLSCRLIIRWFSTVSESDCVHINSSRHWQGVFVDWPLLGVGSFKMPLYIIIPRKKDIWLPTFGIEYEVIDLLPPLSNFKGRTSGKGAVFP